MFKKFQSSTSNLPSWIANTFSNMFKGYTQVFKFVMNIIYSSHTKDCTCGKKKLLFLSLNMDYTIPLFIHAALIFVTLYQDSRWFYIENDILALSFTNCVILSNLLKCLCLLLNTKIEIVTVPSHWAFLNIKWKNISRWFRIFQNTK